MEPSANYRVQVFPSNESAQVPLERAALTRYTREVLERECGLTIPATQDLEYEARVLKPSLDELTTLQDYRQYIDTELSTQLTTLLNDRTSSGRIEVPDGSTVLLTVAPRSLAPLYYRTSALPDSLGYRLKLYNGNEVDAQKALDYLERVKTANKEAAEKLDLIAPSFDEAFFDDPMRLAFVAEDIKSGKILGYAVFFILRRRKEVDSLFVKEMDALLKANPNASERYLMGVSPPENIYELEGLSADPGAAGRNLGSTLINEGLRFIQDKQSRCLYPVSHVTSQAASYVTKLLLTRDYGFHYHGSNLFQNEYFLETLSIKSRGEVMKVIREQIEYYNKLLQGVSYETLSEWLRRPTSHPEKMKHFDDVLRDIVRLYQLFYLLFRRLPRSAAQRLACDTRDTTLAFVELFRSLEQLLTPRPYQSLRNYFARNRLQLSKPVEERNLESSIYTREATKTEEVAYTMGRFADYGFLYNVDDKGGEKKLRTEGYDVIYKSLPNMIRLTKSLNARQDAGLVLNAINSLVLDDLNMPFDYELTPSQLKAISTALAAIPKTGELNEQNKTIGELRKRLDARDKFLLQNERFNAAFTINLYEAPGLFDSFVSFQKLLEQWPKIEEAFNKRVNPTGTLSIPSSTEAVVPIQEEMDVDVFGGGEDEEEMVCEPQTNSPPLQLSVPEELAKLKADIDTLGHLLRGNPSPDKVTMFNGYPYTIRELNAHYLRLEELERRAEMQVEAEPELYRLEEFIDDNLLGDDYVSIL